MAPPQWAYQVENFVTEPDEELVCSICRAVFCDPTLCPCDHVFCRICISKWLQNNRNCPICRKRVSNSSIKQTVPIIKNLIMKLMLNCHNKSFGCKAQFSIESSEAHIKECEYEFVQCRNKPCKDRLFRKDVTEHETSDCPHRYIKCKKCGSKMPTSTVPEKHECIRELQLRLRRKSMVIRKKNDKIKELRNEIKTLKTASVDSGHPRTSSASRYSLTSSTRSSISSDEITINIREYDSQSSSITTESDVSSDNIVIFTNDSVDHSDDNAESDLFSGFMDSVEYSQNDDSVLETSEYRNTGSQTVNVNDQQNDLGHSRSGNLVYNNDTAPAEVHSSDIGETGERAFRPGKRRPTSEKPAKRRVVPLISSSGDDDDDGDNKSKQLKSRSSKRCWRSVEAEVDNLNGAGPSSASAPDNGSNTAVPGTSSKWSSHSKAVQDPKQDVSFVCNNAVNSRTTAPSRNAVFERTLALLEQYNLESDPEWLPQYASHTGNTTSESDSSYDLIESSNSELSDTDSVENNSNIDYDDSQPNPASVSDFMHWMFDSTSEDDPDWRPTSYNSFEDD